jgi:hypothetical protein
MALGSACPEPVEGPVFISVANAARRTKTGLFLTAVCMFIAVSKRFKRLRNAHENPSIAFEKGTNRIEKIFP